MVELVIKIILGLFIWMLLPKVFYDKRKYKSNTSQYFVVIVCKIIGIVLIVGAILNFIREALT